MILGNREISLAGDAPRKPIVVKPPPRPQIGPSWIEQFGQGAMLALQLTNQQRLANENLERARQGLDPLTYGDVPGLVPSMQFGLEDDTRNSGLWLLAIGAAVLLFMNKGGGRRARAYDDDE